MRILLATTLLLFGHSARLAAASGAARRAERLARKAEKLYKKGRYGKAIVVAEKAHAADPKNAAAWRVDGLSRVQRGEFGPALGAFSRHARLSDADSPASAALLAVDEGWRAYWVRRDPRGAVAKFAPVENWLGRFLESQGAAADPLYAAVHACYAKALERIRSLDKALKFLRLARAFDGEAVSAREIELLEAKTVASDATAKGEAAARGGRSREVLRHYRRAYAAVSRAGLNARAYQEAAIRAYLKLDPKPAVPEEAKARVARGLAAVKMASGPEGYERAAAEFAKALEVAPWEPQVYYNMGVVQERADMLKEAVESFQLYLLAAPHARDRKTIQKKVYELGYARELQAERMKELVGTWNIEGKIRGAYAAGKRQGNTYEARPPVIMISPGPTSETRIVKVVTPFYGKYVYPFEWTGSVSGAVLTAAPPVGKFLHVPQRYGASGNATQREGNITIRLLKDSVWLDYANRIDFVGKGLGYYSEDYRVFSYNGPIVRAAGALRKSDKVLTPPERVSPKW